MYVYNRHTRTTWTTRTMTRCGPLVRVQAPDLNAYLYAILASKYNVFCTSHSYSKLTQRNVGFLINGLPHVVACRVRGTPAVLLLTRVNGVDQCVFALRGPNAGPRAWELYLGKLFFDHALFDDTLFEGVLTHHAGSRSWEFVATDLLVARTRCLARVAFPARLDMLVGMVKNAHHHDEGFGLRVAVLRYFHFGQTDDLAREIDRLEKEQGHKTIGIVFKPIYVKFRTLTYDWNSEPVRLTQTSHVLQDIRDKLKGSAEKPDKTHQENDMQVFELVKTKLPDVYELYFTDQTYQNDQTEQPEIACVPDKATSEKLRAIFSDTDRATLTCRFSVDFKKWIPVV